MQRIYLDNNATTCIDPLVKSAMEPFNDSLYGNPNSLHNAGIEVRPHMARALDQLYSSLNANDEDDILIMGCATEGNNSVLKSVWFDQILKGNKKRIITTQIEHPAVTETAKFLESLGAQVVYLPVNNKGIVDPITLKETLNPETDALVSIMWANNETGLINPMAELVEIAHNAGVLFHSDAVQAVGKIKVDLQEVPLDFMTFSAHKFHGPKGVGGLYIRNGVPFVPLLHGGEQMGGLRSGTVNVAGMIAMGEALEVALVNLDQKIKEVSRLRNKLEDGLLEISDVFIIGDREIRTPNTVFASFKGIEGEAMLWDLNRAGICASTGSACASESLEENPTFKAIGISKDLAHTGIRFSLSRFTTESEIDATIEVVKNSVKRLRSITTTRL